MARRWLLLSVVLMVLLGVARAAGGVLLLARGAATDAAIRAGAGAVTAVAAGLVLVGAAEVVCAVGVARGSRRAWTAGIVVTLLFVLGGLVNGAVLYGQPGAGGTAVNAAVAAAIVLGLLRGRGSLGGR